MASLSDTLAAGLLAQGWIETASASPAFRRFGKFGRGAHYVMLADEGPARAEELWFSELRFTDPDVRVQGPILDTLFEVGCKAVEQALPAGQGHDHGTQTGRYSRVDFDADAALDELGRM